MRFSKTAWLILIIGIFVLASGSLYWLYLQEEREQQELSQTLSNTQATVPVLAAEKAHLESTLTELEDRLAQVTSQLKTAKAVFPTASVQSIEVDELLFGIADDSGLEMMVITTTAPSEHQVQVEVEDIEIEDVTYLITSFTVQLKGQVADILGFVDTVVNHSDFTTATVELVSITVPNPVSENERMELSEDEIKERETPFVTIKLIIYTYKGE